MRLIKKLLGYSIVDVLKAERDAALEVFRKQIFALEDINERIGRAVEENQEEVQKIKTRERELHDERSSLLTVQSRNVDTMNKLSALLS